jgi:hypothetical protein
LWRHLDHLGDSRACPQRRRQLAQQQLHVSLLRLLTLELADDREGSDADDLRAAPRILVRDPNLIRPICPELRASQTGYSRAPGDAGAARADTAG